MIRKRNKYRKQSFINRKNPKLYSRTEFATAEKKRRFGFKTLAFLLISGFLYLIFFSPTFKISKADIISSDSKKESIQKKFDVMKDSFLGDNLLFLNIEKLKGEIQEDSDLKDVDVEKNYVKKTVIIRTKEREAVALWNERGKNFLMDSEGIIFREAGESEEATLSLVKINNNIVTLTSKVGEKTVDKEIINFINLIILNFESMTGDKIVSVNFENSVNEITVLTDINYKIFFDTKRDVMNQIENVLLVKKEAEKKSKKGLEYIDLRIETRVFYK